MDVNQLLNRFENAQKMMKQMGGMMGLPGSRRKATKSPKNKRKGKASGGGGARVPFPVARCRVVCPVACRSFHPEWTPTRSRRRSSTSES
jgi:hypothetical protein